MTSKNQEAIPREVLYKILQVLEINIAKFMYLLSKDEPKTIMMYARIYKLYNQSRAINI